MKIEEVYYKCPICGWIERAHDDYRDHLIECTQMVFGQVECGTGRSDRGRSIRKGRRLSTDQRSKKYGEHNVDKGIPTHSFCDSAARHLAKYLEGWDDEPHLLAAAWNLLWAIQMEIKHPEMVDTPWENEDNTHA